MWKILAGCLILLLLWSPPGSRAEEQTPAVPARGVLSRFLEEDLPPEAVARPLNPETDLKMIRLTATEALLEQATPADTVLYIVFRVESRRPDSLPVFLEGEHPDQLEYNGESISLDRFRGSKSLIACELVTGHGGAWYDFSDDGLYLIAFVMNPDAASLEKGSGVSFSCYCENLQTGETDRGTLDVSLPPMTVYFPHPQDPA